MKAKLKLTLFTFTFLLISSYSIATPLSGSYTIGTGGNYPTITLAFDDASAQGINGPVIFNIISGTYNENVSIVGITGSSVINTVTLTSQSGNPIDVIINGVVISADNVIIDKLSFSGDVYLEDFNQRINNITVSNNKFNKGKIYGHQSDWTAGIENILITGNDVDAIYLSGGTLGWGLPITNAQIRNNRIKSSLAMSFYTNLFIEKNIIGNANGYFGLYLNGNHSYIYNNFILDNVFILGNGNGTDKLIYNTIYSGSPTSATIWGGGFTILNNININPSGGTVLKTYWNQPFTFSDYNNFYNGGNDSLIYYGDTFYNNVSDFSNATGFDQHSNSIPVTFMSSNDLHLAGSSIGDERLVGTPDPSVTDDIDGDTRSQFFPYKGADENSDFPLPVELASFTSSVNKNNVLLSWTTSSEVNNNGFDVERSNVKGQTSDEWMKIIFIQGNGTTTSPNNYTFTDKGLNAGKYKYRLKQIDFNGNFIYYNLSNEVTIGVPEKYSLLQNYPNPFNPTTTINYELPAANNVRLIIFDAIGKQLITLVNEKQNAGTYEVEFDGSSLASGIYFYRLQAGDYVVTRRMILLK